MGYSKCFCRPDVAQKSQYTWHPTHRGAALAEFRQTETPWVKGKYRSRKEINYESNNKCCVSKYVRKKKCREQNFVLSLYRKPTSWTSMWHLCTRGNRIEKAKHYNSIQWSSLNWYKQLHHTTFYFTKFYIYIYIYFKFPLHFYVPLDE